MVARGEAVLVNPPVEVAPVTADRDLWVIVGPSLFVLVRAGDRVPSDLVGQPAVTARVDATGQVLPPSNAGLVGVAHDRQTAQPVSDA